MGKKHDQMKAEIDALRKALDRSTAVNNTWIKWLGVFQLLTAGITVYFVGHSTIAQYQSNVLQRQYLIQSSRGKPLPEGLKVIDFPKWVPEIGLPQSSVTGDTLGIYIQPLSK